MTSRRCFAFFWILVLFLTQETLGFVFPRWTPPILLVGVLFFSLIEGPVFGAGIGCAAGFLLDVLGVGKLGASMAILSCLGMLAGFLSSKIFYDSFFTQLLLPFVANTLFCFFNLLLYKNLSENEGSVLDLFRESFVLSQPILTACVSVLVFAFLRKAVKRN